jgi:hypothetical protein
LNSFLAVPAAVGLLFCFFPGNFWKMKKYVEKLIAKADMQIVVLTLLENGLVHQV